MEASDVLARDLLACRLVDLSSDVSDCPHGPFQTRVEVIEATDGAEIFCEKVAPALVPESAGKIRPEHFPDGAFLRHEMVSASVHSGSHIDAPGHYGPVSNGTDGMINSAPLTSFVGAGVMLDVSGIAGWRVEPEHVRAAMAACGLASIDQGTIVLIHTEREKAISADVVADLLDAGVRVIGTDAEGFDGPFEAMIRRFLKTEDPAVLWPSHVLGRRRPYYHIERLRNLASLPARGFVFVALPVLIEGTTAAWTRAVAFVPQESEQI
jgi:cyclase